MARIRRIPAIGRDRHGARRHDRLAVERRAERRARPAEPGRRLPREEPDAGSAPNDLRRRLERLAVDEQHRREPSLVEEVGAMLRVGGAKLDDRRHRRRAVGRHVVGAQREPALLGDGELERRVLHLIERVERAHRIDLARSRLIVERRGAAEAVRAGLEQREDLVLRERRVLLQEQRDDACDDGRRHRRADRDAVRRRRSGGSARRSCRTWSWGTTGFVKTLPAVPGFAVRLSAEMTSAPGAAISGFGTPVAVGPALENQHTSPSKRSRKSADVSLRAAAPRARRPRRASARAARRRRRRCSSSADD